MPGIIDLTGRKVGKLLVEARDEDHVSKSGRKYAKWKCVCECGNRTSVFADALIRGSQVSCGCYRATKLSETAGTHMMSNTRLYGVWGAIKTRCTNKNSPAYALYGGRGIRMCDEWSNDFASFYNWAVQNGYDDFAPRGLCTIDRIDCDGDYTPSNCRLATQLEQMNNIRRNHRIEYNGETHTLAEWSRITGISQYKIRNRVSKLGWTPERALTTV